MASNALTKRRDYMRRPKVCRKGPVEAPDPPPPPAFSGTCELDAQPGEAESFNVDIFVTINHPNCPDEAPDVTTFDLQLTPFLSGAWQDPPTTCAGVGLWINDEDPIDTDYQVVVTINFSDGTQCVLTGNFTYPAP